MFTKMRLSTFILAGFAGIMVLAATLTVFSTFILARNDDSTQHKELLLVLNQKLTEISTVQETIQSELTLIRGRDIFTKTALDSIIEKVKLIEQITDEEKSNDTRLIATESQLEKELKELERKYRELIEGDKKGSNSKKSFLKHCAPDHFPSMFPSEGKLWVISFGLYGASEKYLGGAWDNLQLAKEIYPGWTVRFYVGSDVPQETKEKLKNAGGQIIEMQQVSHDYTKKTEEKMLKDDEDKGSHVSGDTAGMFWRFLPEDDETVERFIVRDSDSRVSWRERAAVYEWIASGKAVHVMRDHTGHGQSMPGGMWGSVRGAITKAAGHSLKELILRWSGDRNKFYADMNFLNDLVWPLISHDVYSHDSFFCKKFNAVGFPVKRIDEHDFVGQVHLGSNAPPIYTLTDDAPLECRRHPSWTKG